VVKNSETNTWEIEHPCPQCGAPVTLRETDRFLSCSYCRVKLYLLPQDYFKYYLPPSESFSKNVLFVPYWRFKGVTFFCKNDGIKYKVSDLSSLASPHTFLPPSLGVRPQTLKLKFLPSKIEAKFFQGQVPLKTIIENMERRLSVLDDSSVGGPVFHTSFMSETVSMIYSPVFIQGDAFHDGILGKPIVSVPEDFADDFLAAGQENGREIKFVSTLCPNCGWDLPGERDSVLLFCNHCESVWEASENGLKPVDFGMIVNKEGHAFYLPFWRMEASVKGLQMDSYADLLRMANVPKVMKKEWERLNFYFWAPAFKLPPEPFLRSTQALTLSEPQDEFERNLPESPLYSANFSSHEAVESIKITIANIAVHRMEIFPKLREMDVQVNKLRLIFVPFTLVGSEFVQSQTQFCIHQNALRLGQNL
jgi:DNA-directed RNA polymerase subunit RPC12/RpoP